MSEIVKERLQLIAEHAIVIEERINGVLNADVFKQTKEGGILLDALITRLQAVSENIKRIQKIDPAFFSQALPLDVTPIIRFRDLASHHYELLNHTIIYDICKSEVPTLKQSVQQFLQMNNLGRP